MNLIESATLVLHVLAAMAVCGFVLLQHGKGADMGAAFGSGSAGSLFGASGSANFLSRTTAVLAAVFFACTLLLAYFGHARPAGGGSLLERAAIGAPVAPAPAPAPVDSAAQIPAGSAAPAPAAPASAPAAPAAGAGQIPAK